MPTGAANPAIGEVGKLENVEEDRVEVLVVDEGGEKEIRGAVEELKTVRPSSVKYNMSQPYFLVFGISVLTTHIHTYVLKYFRYIRTRKLRMKSTGLKTSEFDGDCGPRILPTPERTYLCLHASNGSDQTDA